MRGPSLLDYLRNPQAHSSVTARPRQTERMPAQATLPRRRVQGPSMPMGPTGYIASLDNPQPERAATMSFQDAAGLDRRPLQDEQFPQWLSRTAPPAPLGLASGGGDPFADQRPRQMSDIGAPIPSEGYATNPATGRPFLGAAVSTEQGMTPQGPSWTEANAIAQRARQMAQAQARRGLFGAFASRTPTDPALDALHRRYQPVTRPE